MSIIIKQHINECPAYRTGRHYKWSFISCTGCPAEHPEQLGSDKEVIWTDRTDHASDYSIFKANDVEERGLVGYHPRLKEYLQKIDKKLLLF